MAASYPSAIVTTLKEAANNLTFDLTAPVLIGDTTINVNFTTGAPASGSFHIGTEILFYTSRTAVSFDVTGGRGSDGTAAAGHDMVDGGGEVVFGPEAHHINDLQEEVVAIQTELGANLSSVVRVDDTDVSGTNWIKDEDDMSSDDATKVPTQQSVKAYVDALKPNDIMIMANGFIIAGSDCELVETDGTDTKLYDKHLAVAKTEWFDVPKFRVPDTYDGGDIDITVCFRSAGASKKHSLGIRVASVGASDPYNPDLASAYQLYNEEASDATIGDIKYKTVTVTQSNHKMVAGENWYCKFVMEDDAGADADDVLIEAVRIEWNKG